MATLQHDEESVSGIRVEHALQVGDPLDVLTGSALERLTTLDATMSPCMVVVELDRTFGIDGLELHLVSLSPAHRGEHEYRSAARHGRAQTVEKSNILAVHE